MSKTLKQILIGIVIGLALSATAGGVGLYNQINKNTQFREENKNLHQKVLSMEKNICWIKEHLRGVEVPECE